MLNLGTTAQRHGLFLEPVTVKMYELGSATGPMLRSGGCNVSVIKQAVDIMLKTCKGRSASNIVHSLVFVNS